MSSGPTHDAGTLAAGVARRVITPTHKAYLAGYGERFRSMRGVRDELTATAIVLDDGHTRVAWLAVDALAIHEAQAARVRAAVEAQTGIPGDHVMIACSHTHGALVLSVQAGGRDSQARAVEATIPRLVEAVVEASLGLVPATLSGAVGESSLPVQRRVDGPDGKAIFGFLHQGPHDRSVTVLRVSRDTGEPLATLVNMACHPTILGPRHRLVTADWPGEVRRHVEAATDGAPMLFLQGGTGDQNPDHDWGDDDEDKLVRLGGKTAESVLATCDRLEPLAGAPIAARFETLWLPLEPARRTPEGPALTWQQALRRESRLPLPDRAIEWILRKQYPWEARVRELDDGTVAVGMDVQAFRLGDVALVAQGAEVFHAIGQALKGSTDARLAMFCGYANGMIGYLPAPGEYARGGYEVELAPWLYRLPGLLAPDAGQRAIDASRALARSLAP